MDMDMDSIDNYGRHLFDMFIQFVYNPISSIQVDYLATWKSIHLRGGQMSVKCHKCEMSLIAAVLHHLSPPRAGAIWPDL